LADLPIQPPVLGLVDCQPIPQCRTCYYRHEAGFSLAKTVMAPQHVPRQILGQTLGQVLGHKPMLCKLLLSGASPWQLTFTARARL
jgi:hypothetical protein